MRDSKPLKITGVSDASCSETAMLKMECDDGRVIELDITLKGMLMLYALTMDWPELRAELMNMDPPKFVHGRIALR